MHSLSQALKDEISSGFPKRQFAVGTPVQFDSTGITYHVAIPALLERRQGNISAHPTLELLQHHGVQLLVHLGTTVSKKVHTLSATVRTTIGMDPAGTCAVCLDDIRDVNELAYIECKHTFHSSCILKWAKVENTCPLCKVKFDRVYVGQDRRITRIRRKKQCASENDFEAPDFDSSTGSGDTDAEGDSFLATDDDAMDYLSEGSWEEHSFLVDTPGIEERIQDLLDNLSLELDPILPLHVPSSSSSEDEEVLTFQQRIELRKSKE